MATTDTTPPTSGSEPDFGLMMRQQRRMLDEMGEMRDDMRVMMAMMQRFDGTLGGLVNELGEG